jgi:putative spermidine/putrescine transport system permease protein
MGANWPQRSHKVILHLLAPGLTTTSILTFVHAFSVLPSVMPSVRPGSYH